MAKHLGLAQTLNLGEERIMEYVKVHFHKTGTVVINDSDGGETNAVLPVGDPGWYWISVKSDDYVSQPVGIKISGTSDIEPMEVEFEQV